MSVEIAQTFSAASRGAITPISNVIPDNMSKIWCYEVEFGKIAIPADASGSAPPPSAHFIAILDGGSDHFKHYCHRDADERSDDGALAGQALIKRRAGPVRGEENSEIRVYFPPGYCFSDT